MFWSIALSCALLGQVDEAAKGSDAVVDAGQKELKQQADLLIVQILRGSLNQREMAEQKLIDLGPAALEVLPPTKEDDPDVLKDALRRVRRLLQKKAAEAAGEATLITLKGEMPLSKVMAAFQQQSGNLMIDWRGEAGQEQVDPTIKVDLRKVPFWQALDGVLDQAGLTTYGYPDKPGVAYLVRGEDAAPHKDRALAYSGPFRVEVVELEARRYLRNPARQRLMLKLETSWEPRLVPISIQLPMSTIQATDENGKPIPVAIPNEVAGAEVVRGMLSTQLVFPFQSPSRDVKRIASLQGKLSVLVPGKVGTYEFKLQAEHKKPITQEQSGVKVVLDRVRMNGDVWQVGVVLSFEKAEGALSSHRSWVTNNETYLINPAGERVDFNGFELYRQTESEVGIAYSYDLENGPAGFKLVYKTPSVIMNLPVEFEIKNVDLP